MLQTYSSKKIKCVKLSTTSTTKKEIRLPGIGGYGIKSMKIIHSTVACFYSILAFGSGELKYVRFSL